MKALCQPARAAVEIAPHPGLPRVAWFEESYPLHTLRPDLVVPPRVETTGLAEGLGEPVKEDFRLALFIAGDVLGAPRGELESLSRLGMAGLF